MSIKIYEGYRFPMKHLGEFLELVHGAMFERVKFVALVIRDALTEEAVKKRVKESWAKDYILNPEDFAKHERTLRCEALEVIFKEVSQSPYRHPFYDIECGFNLWPYKGKVYAIPYGEYWTRRGIVYPEWVEDYQYFNNVDRPKGITARQWRSREATWNRVCLDDWDIRRMTFNLISLPPNCNPTYSRLWWYLHKAEPLTKEEFEKKFEELMGDSSKDSSLSALVK